MTEFAGFEMPVWYTSISDEHLAVRNACGIFDVSHMGRIAVKGPDAGRLLEGLVPTPIEGQPVCKSIYTIFLNPEGGILDDLIVMKRSAGDYIAVVNAANTRQDLEHILESSGSLRVDVSEETGSSAMIAVQGPRSREALQGLTDFNLQDLKRFRCVEAPVLAHPSTISRTGYTGEDGYELIIHGTTNEDPSAAIDVWSALAKLAKTCGLGARDSLRTEAGYPLYGQDIDTKTNPFEADLAWVISPDKKDYVGQEAIQKSAKTEPSRLRRGILLADRIPRQGFEVLDQQGEPIGNVTSGTFSPILHRGIALAYVRSADSEPGKGVKVRVRDSTSDGTVVKPPFYDQRLFGWKRQSNGN
jgi:aminomethyltransferase